jgi:carbonic anhydrase
MMTSIKILTAGLLAFALVNSGYAALDNAAVTQWSYKGANSPAHWGNLDPAFNLCATGKRQSPIDINPKKATLGKSAFTLEVKPNQYQLIIKEHLVQLNVPRDLQSKETLTLEGRTYHLAEFHFHAPSETQLYGESSTAEIHFTYQDNDGKLAVIAVFVKVGAANPVLQTIVDHLPNEENKEVAMKDSLDISKLISAKHGAYQFEGSLTTPPCTEGITWLVMVDTMTASSGQILKLRKAAHGANARPVQPFNKRPITFVTGKMT